MTSISSIDQQFVEYIVKSLVGNPDAVIVERRIDEKGVLLELTVDPEDLGRVIGKRGATAQSLRTLLRALGTKNDARYNLKIVDNGVARDDAEDTGARSDTHDSAASQPAGQAGNQDDDDDLASQEDIRPTEANTSASTSTSTESARMSRTRQELQDLDDLDV